MNQYNKGVDKLLKASFFKIVRLGIGLQEDPSPDKVDWQNIQALALQQGLSALALDGVGRLPESQRPPKRELIQWIGETLQYESKYAIQKKSAKEMALLFHNNAIRTYVLKGDVVAECYPNPIHRLRADLDCFLLPLNRDFDAWKLGNDLIRGKGFNVETIFYKNSTIILPGLMVENHRFFTPFRGNKRLMRLERVLQTMLREDKGEDRFEGTWLYRPPVMVTALFLIEHAYSHFLHEGLTWKHILDWMMFSKKHKNEIQWAEFSVLIDEFWFRRFYDSYVRLGEFLFGERTEGELSREDQMILNDVWAPLALHETARGVKGKLALARNTWRARWKYRYFSDISMLHALWIQVKGFLFIKHPKLN